MRWLLIVLCLIWAPQARATCLSLSIANLTLTQTFVGGSGEYNPFTATTYNQTVGFDVSGGANLVPCTYFLVLAPGASGNATQRTLVSGAKTLNYNAYVDVNNVLKDLGTATTSQVISGSFAVGTSGLLNHHTFTWTITPGQVRNATATRYSDSAVLTLYTGLLGVLWTQADTRTITFQSKVDSSVDLSLVDSTSPFDITDILQTVDFGNLVSGTTKGFDIVVRSDDGYKVTLQSANKQKLLIQNATYTDKVPYTLTVGGVTVDLSSGGAVSAVSSSGTTTTASGVVLPVVVKLGTLTGTETSGTYKDIVTVTVIAN